MASGYDKTSTVSEPADLRITQKSAENVHRLKKARSTAKGVVTRKRNEINELLLDSVNVLNTDELNKRLLDLESAMEKFIIAHQNYHKNLQIAEDIEESEEYFGAEMGRVNNLKQRISILMENQPSSGLPDVRPEDSISNTGVSKMSVSKHSKTSRRSSSQFSSSLASSMSSAKAKAIAKKAALKAEAATFDKKLALQREEFHLQQKREALELETKLAKLNAEERAYIEIENEGRIVQHNIVDQKTSTALPIYQSPSPLEPPQFPDISVPGHQQGLQILNPNAEEWSNDSKGAIPVLNSQQVDEKAGPSFDSSVSNIESVKFMMTAQKQQNDQIEQLLTQQRRHTSALLLPQPDIPIFGGEAIEYCSFIRAFENLIEAKTDNSSARLYYLVQYTTGDVQELMRSCLAMGADEGYKEARRLLKERYGQNYKIAAAYVERLTKGQPLKTEDGAALQKFSVLLTSCKNTLKDIGYLNKLENPDALKKIVDRLPFGLRRKWRSVVDDIIYSKDREITVEDIATFVEKSARVATHPIFGNITNDSKGNDSGSKPKRKSGASAPRVGSFAIKNGDKPGSQPKGTPKERSRSGPYNVQCPLCNQNHWLSQCSQFKSKSLAERLEFVRKKGLCDNCLVSGHLARSCERASFCRVQGCEFKHSTYLHPPSTKPDGKQKDGRDNEDAKGDRDRVTGDDASTQARSGYVKSDKHLHTQNVSSSQVTGLAIVPVTVKAKDSDTTVDTYAFLDGGSNATFCTEKLLKHLNTNGNKTTLSLTTMERENSKTESSIVSLEIFDLSGTNLVELPTVFSIAKLPVTNESMATQQDADKWPHFNGIQLPTIDADVSLLIGSNVPQALAPLEVRRGAVGEPYATKTALGWVVNGPLGKTGKLTHSANFVKADTLLNQQFEKYCNMEFNDSTVSNKPAMSQEDQRALGIMNETVKLKDGHYEMALPWRNTPPSLPNNKSMADHRLKLLKRRMTNNPILHKKYKGFIDDLLSKGYARKVPDQLLKEPEYAVWYLPHHPVFHPQKPEKIRVVFDCSAKYQGTALNHQLLQGPDLTNSLVGVLTRFREEPIALMSDVEAMFHQVRVRPDDCNALRFLWWPDGDLSRPSEEFQMMVHLFGGTSSPSCANFALRKTADDNKADFDNETIQTIKRNFYVDDCLKSVKSEQKAIRLAGQLSRCLARGGFRLTKWMSNSPKVIKSVPESERAPSIKQLDFEKLHVERPLGVQWNVASDKFGFKIVVKNRPETRRGILSIVSSIYDPLGFAAPFILPAKAILQDLCRKKLGWDDPIPEDEARSWHKWLDELPQLENLEIDRCFKPRDFGDITSRQLHHFSDASQQGYGAASYLRITNSRGDIHCSFVIGKARLAPLKPMTIPRMELSAAVVATRLDKMVQQELSEQTTSESIFWTDSTCVLRYIENEDKRFQTFVANRVTTIRDASSPAQWRYVDTKSNPADDASRGLTAEAFLQDKRWLNGPQFLREPEEAWPQRPAGMNQAVKADDPEVKKETRNFATAVDGESDITCRIFERFSSWYRLKKFVAWMMRYKHKLKERRTSLQNRQTLVPPSDSENEALPITVDEMESAETEIIKYIQRKHFAEEMSTLKPFKKSSSIYKLDPKRVDGVLRVGGRLRHAPITDAAKYPVILPKRHHIVELIVRHCHELSGHSGLEYVLSLTRQRYWIIKARNTIRRILSSCILCKRRQAPVGIQKMADLPEDRVTPYVPPFTNSGVDYFGPIMVRRGRSTEKRYGAIFTCLSIRAIHIEISHSLDTDSFIDAMRRFIARRGQPQRIRSDNGSNFVGGEKELREAINDWNHQQIHNFLLQKSTKWIFNPPAGSHHGGVWERCIRTVRKVIKAILREQTLDDEGLLTLMCEVESIVNGRPITKMSDDPRDSEALTPNHLLLLRSGPTLPPATLAKQDLYSSRWRQVQYLADVFWRRWLREYLPSLQQRHKWNSPMRDFAVGDIVLVVDDKNPRGSWPLGRIQEVYSNRSDGHVRRVKVKTMKSTYERPIDKIVLLECAAATEPDK